MTASWVRVGDVCLLHDLQSGKQFPVNIRRKFVSPEKVLQVSVEAPSVSAGMVHGTYQTEDCRRIFFNCKQRVGQSEPQ